jgi:hypothetical protein
MTPTFQGEVQFRRWSDSSTQGVQVTFALPDSGELEPLKGKEGKRFMAVLVEIGDEEQPVQPQPRKDQRGPLCREACDYCENPLFWKWATTMSPVAVRNEGDAIGFVYAECGIDSRNDLDKNERAANKFAQAIRVPFIRWARINKEQG